MTYYIVDTIFCLIYGIIDFKIFSGLNSLKNGQATHTEGVSILLAAKDEAHQIAQCIDSLINQNYSSFEILIANDRSTDNTLSILEEYSIRFPDKIKYLNIQDDDNLLGWSPKKFAINELISIAQYDYILLTDADCIAPPTWTKAMMAEFEDGIEFVVGHSIYHKVSGMNQTFYGIQALDFISHMIVACGAIVKKFPITSTGTSLAYKKSWFKSVAGFEGVSDVPSGDDDLLLHKISNENPRAIRFCANVEAAVITYPASTPKALWEQRKRWASKTILYTPRVVSLLLFVFIFYSYIFLGLIFSLLTLNPLLFSSFTVMWFLKTLADFIVMKKGTKTFHHPEFITYFTITSILHIPMIFFSVIFGIFSKFEWKK